MRQTINRFLWVVLLVAGVQASWGFALLGPIANGGDAWQTAVIGYNYAAYVDERSQINPGGPVFLGDIGAPKNIGEGYRRNVNTNYYAYNANFLDFFGTTGASYTDGAFAIMNSLTNVDSYSSSLSEFPYDSQHYNYEAQSLFLTDIKSETLHLLVEQMGLEQPERFTWALAERNDPPGCPLTTSYLVVQRNFGITPTALNQVQYSPYVNNVLYSYYIVEDCTGPNPLAWTVPFSVDPFAQQYTSVAANSGNGLFILPVSFGGLQVGGFYTGLTLDDVAGLRYLYSTNNLARETSQATLLSTNVTTTQIQLTTLDLGLLLAQSATNNAATLEALYPGLLVSSTTNGLGLVYTTNVTAYYTNAPGPAVTNYDTQNLFLINTMDFNLFWLQALTNNTGQVANSALAITQLQALYPGLVIVSATPYYTNVVTTNYVTYLTNEFGNGTVYPPPIITVTVVSSIVTSFQARYNYVFGNLMLNVNGTFVPFTSFTASSGLFNNSEYVTIQNITVTNLVGAPYGSPLETNITTQTVLTHNPMGNFFIMPTNWCGFTVAPIPPNPSPVTQIFPSYTNTVSTTVTNQFGVTTATQNTISTYANYLEVVEPGVCEPVLVYATNTTTTVANTGFTNTFLNIVTNIYSPTSLEIIVITNIYSTNGEPVGTLVTNVINPNFTNSLVTLPSGDFFIVPTNWCGFTITTLLTNVVATTNTILIGGTATNGAQSSLTTVTYFTNHTILVNANICSIQAQAGTTAIREGIEKVEFVRADYDSLIGQFFQPITNYYTMQSVTNSQLFTQYFQRVITQPDILMTADNDIAGNTFDGTVTRNINFDQGNILPGLAGPGVINAPVTFSYNKIGTAFDNGPLEDTVSTNQFLSQLTQYPASAWASFDSSTNDPVVYPDGTSISNLENQIIIQISPTSVAPGTHGVAYAPVTFTVTDTSLPLVWSWSPVGTETLPPGLTLSSGGTLSGTPTQSGTFDFILQMTDSINRTVQWQFTIIIN